MGAVVLRARVGSGGEVLADDGGADDEQQVEKRMIMHTNRRHLGETLDTCADIEIGTQVEEISVRDCSVLAHGRVTAITVLDPTNPLSDVLTYETQDRYVERCRRYHARPVGALVLYEGYWEAPGVWGDKVARPAQSAGEQAPMMTGRVG